MTATAPLEATAFAPGHITGFFAVESAGEDPSAIGSSGAGFSVELGVASRVAMRRGGFPGVQVLEGGRPVEAETTRSAVQFLVGREPWDVTVDQRVDLPVGQGFGMSAAGALSAALGVASALGRPVEDALWAAHAAEVVHRTGLGDAVGSFLGGFEVRVKAGLPPVGRVERFAAGSVGTPVVLAVLAGPVPTRRVLADAEARSRITAAGRRALEGFLARRDVAAFVAASRRFAGVARLETPPVAQALAALGPRAQAAQCMLGSSVFCLDPSSDEEEALRAAASWTGTTRVAAQGAHVVDSSGAVGRGGG